VNADAPASDVMPYTSARSPSYVSGKTEPNFATHVEKLCSSIIRRVLLVHHFIKSVRQHLSVPLSGRMQAIIQPRGYSCKASDLSVSRRCCRVATAKRPYGNTAHAEWGFALSATPPEALI
jgi:hypothetical protein